jgi:hypothetical protein
MRGLARLDMRHNALAIVRQTEAPMTNSPNPEAQLASTARAWRQSSHGSDLAARAAAERRLADAVEQWLAGLLEADPHWPQQGRWYDGLVFHQCTTEDDGDRLHLSGHVWGIDQRQYPFRAELHLAPDTDGLAAFEARLALPGPSTKRRAEPEWTFHFTRGA